MHLCSDSLNLAKRSLSRMYYAQFIYWAFFCLKFLNDILSHRYNRSSIHKMPSPYRDYVQVNGRIQGEEGVTYPMDII